MANSDTFKENNPIDLNPFKGPSSYNEHDTLYGREDELNELIGIISQHTLSMLFSKSGVGKTSLLKAGVIRVLNSRPDYFPVYIRVTEIPSEESFSKLIIEQIKISAKKRLVEISFNETFMPANPTVAEFLYLSEFLFRKTEIAGKTEIFNPIPVLIFDQAEVIFTGKISDNAGVKSQNKNTFNNKITEFLNDLKNIIEGRIPESLNKILEINETDEKNSFITKLKSKLQYNSKWYRILFSFREEYLHRFESLKFQIPAFSKTNCRLHLESFSVEKAAVVMGEISKQHIEIPESIAQNLASILSTTDEEITKTEQLVPPFMLSLVCRNIYSTLIKDLSAKESSLLLQKIENLDVSLVSNVIDEYAAEVFNRISPNTKKYIEEELVTERENRTMSALADVNDEKIKNDLDKLCDDPDIRYLNRIDYFGEPHCEILHDRLLKPCIESRAFRRKKEFEDKQTEAEKRKRKLIARALGVLSCIFIISLLFFINENRKKDKYFEFFKKENGKHLTELKNAMATDPISGLIEIMDYEENTKKLPYYNGFFAVDLFGGNKKISKELGDFQKSICAAFDSTSLFSCVDFDKQYYYSANQIIRFRDSVSKNDTIFTIIDKYGKSGFLTFRYIHIIGQKNKESKQADPLADSLILAVQRKNKRNFKLIENSDSLIYTTLHDSLYIYNIYKPMQGVMKPIFKADVSNSKFRLSADGHLLFLSKNHNGNISGSKLETISVINVLSGSKIREEAIPVKYFKYILSSGSEIFESDIFYDNYSKLTNSSQDFTDNGRSEYDNHSCFANNKFYFINKDAKPGSSGDWELENFTYKLISYPKKGPDILLTQNSKISNLKFYSNEFIAGYSDQALNVFNLEGQKLLMLDSVPFPISAIYFVKNKQILLVGLSGQILLSPLNNRKLDEYKNNKKDFVPHDSTDFVSRSFLSPDKSKLLVIYRTEQRKRYAKLIDIENMAVISSVNNLNTVPYDVQFVDSVIIINSVLSSKVLKWYYLVNPPYTFTRLEAIFSQKKEEFPQTSAIRDDEN